jgi:hypothetical protein
MTATVPACVEGPWDHGEFTITCTRRPRPDLKDSFWALYEESFGPLRVRAVARQVLTEAEFEAELNNPRIWKYVARDACGELAGLTTLTDDVSTMPWISPEYFEHRYPEEWRRNAVFYVGITLVRPDMRRDRVFAMMAKYVGQRVASAGGVLGYDICGHNDQDRSLGRATAKILGRVGDFQVGAVDLQTYYVARAAVGSEEELV